MKAYASVLDVPGPSTWRRCTCSRTSATALLDEFERKQIPEIWINPGAESDELMAEASRRGMNVIFACSIVGIGRSPSQFS